MKFSYLLINILSVFFPVVLSFDKRVHFYKSWRHVLPAILITGCIFILWDILFMRRGVWSFNPRYVTGITIAGLPAEEALFFITVPFACLFIYACLNYYIKWQPGFRFTSVLSGIIVLLSVLAILLHYNRLYTLVTFSLLLILIALFQYILKAYWLGCFYRAYLVALVPFYIINGILTAVPIVLYNDAHNLGVRLGTIPVEDHFYLMALLLMNTGLFEYFSKIKQPQK